MAQILYPPQRPQSVGEILDSAFRIFSSTLLSCIALAVIGRIAAQLPNIYSLLTGGPRSLVFAARDPKWWGLYVVGLCLALWLWGAMLLRQHARATRAQASLGAALGTATRRLPGLLGIAVLMFLTLMVCAMPVGVFAGIFQRGLIRLNPVLGIAFIAVAVLIPMGWLALRWSCAGTMYLLEEGRGPLASMSRSWQLTSGSFWRLGLIYTVALVLIVVIDVLSGIVTGLVAAVLAHGDVAVTIAVVTTSMVLLNSVALPFYSAIALVVLADLEVRKEGVDLAQRIAAPAIP